jgi:hypothetical protein
MRLAATTPYARCMLLITALALAHLSFYRLCTAFPTHHPSAFGLDYSCTFQNVP